MEGISKGRERGKRGRRRGKVGQNFVIERTKARDDFANERADRRRENVLPAAAGCMQLLESFRRRERELVAPSLTKFLGQWMRQWYANISTLMLSHW